MSKKDIYQYEKSIQFECLVKGHILDFNNQKWSSDWLCEEETCKIITHKFETDK